MKWVEKLPDDAIEVKEFKEIVLALKERYELDIPDEEVLMQANAWEISHGGLSGRTAQQFIDYLRGK